MKRAFTLAEVLVVLSIIVALAGLSYPAFVSVHRMSMKATCESNFHQIGLAMAMYRTEYDGADVGTPVEMGMPNDMFGLPTVVGLRCHGTDPEGHPPGYYQMWPGFDSAPEALSFWSRFVARYGSATVFLFDPCHQPSPGPLNRTWQDWTILGLRLDTSAFSKRRRGYPFTIGWWH